MSLDPNYQWKDLLDIDDSDLPLTPVLRSCNRHVRETITITSTQNTNEEVEEKPFRIILGPAGIVQLAKIRKQLDIHEGGDDSVLSTQEYIKQVVKYAGEDKDFNSRSWVGVTEYVKANGDISYSLNSLGDLKVTVRHLSGTLPGLIHYKVINEGGYGKKITIESAIILANVSVFSPNLSMHYLNITKKNMVKDFHKDFVPGNGSGVGESGMLMEEEEIVKLVEEEEMADLELHVCRNVIDQEDLYKFDEEVLDLVLEEEAGESRAHEEWLEKCGRALEANKAITHPVIDIFLYPLGAVEAACALEVDAMGALDLMEVEAVGALDFIEVGAVGSSSSLSLEI
nr:hypothetical protein [Tanacetum cinerariifolium]